MIDLEIKAKNTRDILKNNLKLFPYRCCKFAVIEMYEKNFEIIKGIVRLDNYCEMNISREIPHFWNRCSKTGKNIDITASQFNIHLSENKQLPDIFIWSKRNNTFYTEERTNLKPNEII